MSHIQLPLADAGVIPWESIIPPVMLMPLPQECIGFCIFLFISVPGDLTEDGGVRGHRGPVPNLDQSSPSSPPQGTHRRS